jgi:predicted dehydrogenase
MMKATNSPITRRRFLAKSTQAAAALAMANAVLPRVRAADQPRQLSSNDKLNIAFLGVGGRGGNNLAEITAAEEVNVVALCDVDEPTLVGAAKRFPSAKRYRDFRKLFEAEKTLDAVVISTPDHTHALACVTALKLRKHVYCEKPLTRTVREARLVTQAAREAKVATQMGNQGMAFEGNRQIKEWLADGVIGPVREVHVWSDRPTNGGKAQLYWPQGIERPTDTPPVPANLDWELWLGPAPWRPYHSAYVPFKWRGWWDFGSGGLGDMGIHNIAPVASALKLGAPTCVYGSSTPLFPETVPSASIVHYEFPARGDLPAVKMHWYDGGLMPPRPDELEEGRELKRFDGIIFVGDKGKLLVDGWGGEQPKLIPEARNREYKRPPQTLPRSAGHHKEWLLACRTGSPTESNFDFAGPLTETVLLGTVCIRNGGDRILWDSANLKITNDQEPKKFLHQEYRAGWEL